MPKFIDIHNGFNGVTEEQLREAHQKDLDNEKQEGVHFTHWSADPDSGKVFCFSEGPNKEAVKRVHARAGHSPDEIYELRYSGG